MVEIISIPVIIICVGLIWLHFTHKADIRKEAKKQVYKDEILARWYNANRENIKN